MEPLRWIGGSMDALGSSCSWTGAKWHAPHSHWCSQEGDSDDWATQGLHINYPGVCPTEVTPASLFSVSTQHGRLVDTGYKSNLHRHRGGCCRQPLTVGEAIIVHWSATARLKPGQLHVGADLPESACLFALHSHTRCCSTTTDWQQCTRFVLQDACHLCDMYM